MIKEFLVKILKLEGLINNLTAYLETRMQLFKLEIQEDITRAVGKVALMLLISLGGFLFILFFSVSMAYLIGESLGMVAGFGIVAAFYLVVTAVLVLTRKAIGEVIQKQVMDSMKNKSK